LGLEPEKESPASTYKSFGPSLIKTIFAQKLEFAMSKRLEQLQQLLSQKPQDAFLRFALAKEYEKQAEQELALQQYAAIHKDTPEYIGLYYHYAALLIENEEEKIAMNIYEEGITLAQKTGDAHSLAELKNAKMNLEMGL